MPRKDLLSWEQDYPQHYMHDPTEAVEQLGKTIKKLKAAKLKTRSSLGA